jgi:hypothetical protein
MRADGQNMECSELRSGYVSLLNHPVGEREHGRRNRQPQRLRGLEVDGEVEPSRLLDRQIAGPFAIEDAADMAAGQAKCIRKICPVAGQAPDLDYSSGHRVVVVDDGSSDATAEIGARAGDVVVRHPINLGQGVALQTGITFALAQGADLL